MTNSCSNLRDRLQTLDEEGVIRAFEVAPSLDRAIRDSGARQEEINSDYATFRPWLESEGIPLWDTLRGSHRAMLKSGYRASILTLVQYAELDHARSIRTDSAMATLKETLTAITPKQHEVAHLEVKKKLTVRESAQQLLREFETGYVALGGLVRYMRHSFRPMSKAEQEVIPIKMTGARVALLDLVQVGEIAVRA